MQAAVHIRESPVICIRCLSETDLISVHRTSGQFNNVIPDGGNCPKPEDLHEGGNALAVLSLRS